MRACCAFRDDWRPCCLLQPCSSFTAPWGQVYLDSKSLSRRLVRSLVRAQHTVRATWTFPNARSLLVDSSPVSEVAILGVMSYCCHPAPPAASGVRSVGKHVCLRSCTAPATTPAGRCCSARRAGAHRGTSRCLASGGEGTEGATADL
eukprot:1155430-Pelagomonas_calceolata.AAC.7